MPQRTAVDCDIMQSWKTCFWIIYNDTENCSWFKQNGQVMKSQPQPKLRQIFLKYRTMPKCPRIWLLKVAALRVILILILCALVFSEYSRINIIFLIEGKKKLFLKLLWMCGWKTRWHDIDLGATKPKQTADAPFHGELQGQDAKHLEGLVKIVAWAPL